MTDRLGRKPKVLLFSTLFPSVARPGHGVFVETRQRHLRATGEVDVKVVAPVPWFPSANPRYGEYAKFAATPAYENYKGVEVFHPRYFLPPKVGMHVAPYTLAWGARACVARLVREGFDFDLIDAHYYYPDGVAAAMLSRWFGKPFVVTARGTDLNLIPRFAWPRRLILQTAHEAKASIGVCAALMDELAALGADRSKLHVFRNGVDLQLFTPQDRRESRSLLGLSLEDNWMVSVGHLIERKGHEIAIEALAQMPAWRLAIVGDGEMRAALAERVARFGLADRVVFAGARPQAELKHWFSAADVSVLCSNREGWANVLLESMACGTPVVATNIWGTPEVVQSPVAGRLMARRDAGALRDGVLDLHAAAVHLKTYAPMQRNFPGKKPRKPNCACSPASYLSVGPERGSSMEALLLVLDFVITILLLIAVLRAERGGESSDLGLFSYREWPCGPAESAEKGQTDA